MVGELGNGHHAHDADTASVRGARSLRASRCMRNRNSTPSKRNASGSGASSHHSGVTSVLMEIAPEP
jgi:hypothetical protein